MRCFLALQFDPKKVLEGVQVAGGTFNENKTSDLPNSEILKKTKNPS